MEIEKTHGNVDQVGMRNAFGCVEEFESRVAEYAGSKFGIAVDSGSHAIFLSCLYSKVGVVEIPACTYISVPSYIIHAGGRPKFIDLKWEGVYELYPYNIWDGAKRFRRNMYSGGLHCLSFHMKKHIPIGRGGMILTDDYEAARWLRVARYDGREGLPYDQERVKVLGWNFYMTPDQAGRGLQLLDQYMVHGDGLPDLKETYADLRKHPVFAEYA